MLILHRFFKMYLYSIYGVCKNKMEYFPIPLIYSHKFLNFYSINVLKGEQL